MKRQAAHQQPRTMYPLRYSQARIESALASLDPSECDLLLTCYEKCGWIDPPRQYVHPLEALIAKGLTMKLAVYYPLCGFLHVPTALGQDVAQLYRATGTDQGS